jgi:hypothetical protein
VAGDDLDDACQSRETPRESAGLRFERRALRQPRVAGVASEEGFDFVGTTLHEIRFCRKC